MHTLAIIAAAWRWNPAGLACCAIWPILFVAAKGWRSWRRLAWFAAGDVFLATVVCSPLDLLARQYLLTAEEVEQVLIALAATYLLVRGVPQSAARRLRLQAPRFWHYFAFAAGMAAISMWQVPRLLNVSLANPAVRGLEYLTLSAGGIAFWWPIHSSAEEQRIPMVPTSLLYLTGATVWCSVIGLIVAFAQPWSNARYLQPEDTLGIADSLVKDWSFTRELDQQTAGLLFWVGAATVLLTEVFLIYIRWYRADRVSPSPGQTRR